MKTLPSYWYGIFNDQGELLEGTISVSRSRSISLFVKADYPPPVPKPSKADVAAGWKQQAELYGYFCKRIVICDAKDFNAVLMGERI